MAVGEYVGNGNPDGTSFGQSGEKISFYGATPVAVQASAAAGTDAATTQTLANALRTALLNYGLIA
jgi:ApbE superfamily uncharacterized protein (UPF0280 family)